jgi:hypothetical protein
MSNYESIPVGTRDIIEDGLHLNDNLKNAVGRLWRLYLRVNHGESDPAEQELQNFLNSLQQYIGEPETMLNVIDQKINDVDGEINGNDFNGRGGIKIRKKRKRTTKKRSKKRRKTLKGGKDKTPLYLNKTFYLRDEITRQRQQEELERQQRERQERERQERERQQRERQERERQERDARQRREELEAHQRKEKAFWAQFP